MAKQEGEPQREENTKTLTFSVAEHGLDTMLDEVLSEEEFNSRSREDFEPNRHWYDITVANESDKDRWVNAKNEWLSLAWSPNQSREEQTKNSERMGKLEDEMRELENKVRSIEKDK
jgi:hypothetical protein